MAATEAVRKSAKRETIINPRRIFILRLE